MEHQDDLSANAQSGSTRSEGESATLKPRFAGLYREDVVQSAGQPGVMGMVTKVAGDSDSSSSDSESDDDAESIAQGCARVCWTNLEESTEKIEDIRVVDRAFMHGDIVAAVSSPLGQIGTVVNVDLKVDLELPSGEILKGIDTRKIKRIRSFVVGDYVIHDHWLGRVDEVVDNVTVLFDDGSKCKVVRADPERLCPSPLSPMDDTDCPYYPGQRVRAISSALFKTARWLKGSWKANRMEGTVTDVEVGSVMVYWIAAAHTGYNSQPAAIPSEQQDPKHLQRMADLSHTNWQLGDRALLPQKLTKRGSPSVSVSVEVPHSECEETESSEIAGYTHALEELGTIPASNNKDSSSESWIAYKRKLKKRISKHKKRAPKKDDLMEIASLIVGTKSKVDVVWQDGTQERGVDSCTLFPVDHLGDHDFWPEQHVMEKGADFEGPESESKRVGIVKSVDSKQRTAKVRWLLPSANPEDGCRFENEEDIVSVYELIEHPDYSYSLGDVVIRLCSSASASSEVSNTPVRETEAASSSNTDGKFDLACEIGMENKTKVDPVNVSQRTNKVEGKATSADFSWVGIIIGLQDGEIKVAWADGQVSKVGPQAIFVVGRDEDDESSQTSDIGNIEEVDDAGSWTTVDSAMEVNEEQELGQLDWDENSGWEGHKEASSVSEEINIEGQEPHATEGASHGLGSALALPFAALIRALRFAAGFIWTLRGSKRTLGSKQGLGSLEADSQAQAGVPERQLDGSDNDQLVTESRQMFKETGVVESALIDEHQECSSSDLTYPNTGEMGAISTGSTNLVPDEANMLADESTVAINDNATQEAGPRSAEPCGTFKQFDSVKDSLDHHFASEASQPSSQRRWSKKIQQEWIMLEKNLPDTIYVRVYEDRMDLMRAVIVGAAGTPYQDGLFFFDIHMPPDYPSVPPLVHYHSGGLRLNPNLYETGKVCLSLLNTWTGKGNEIWHPSTSSILQVLVSIQGLVLNANPYFNEAGYDRQIGTAEGEKNSLAYTENSFLLSCKSMLYVMRRPPKHFEEFVQEHFKQRGLYILRACKAYMKGYPVGCLLDDATASPSHGKDPEQTSSAGFKIMLSKIMPRLVTALEELGANCEQFEMS